MAEIRPARNTADLERWLEVRNAVMPDDKASLEGVLSWMRASKQVHLLAFEGDELIAIGLAVKESWQPAPRVRPMVPPERRGRGLGSALLVELSRWAADAGHTALLAHVDIDDAHSIGFAERRGFAEIGRELKVALDLTGDLLVIEPPPGVEIVTWAERPELVQGLYEVFSEGALDIPGEADAELESFEEWLANEMSGDGDRPEWTFVAVAGDEAVGYSKWSMSSAEPHRAYHDLTAVKRAWRGRGIAGALKSAQLQWAKEHGYKRAVTRNEERNAPIRRLNERFGYQPAGGALLMRGPIQGGTG